MNLHIKPVMAPTKLSINPKTDIVNMITRTSNKIFFGFIAMRPLSIINIDANASTLASVYQISILFNSRVVLTANGQSPGVFSNTKALPNGSRSETIGVCGDIGFK